MLSPSSCPLLRSDAYPVSPIQTQPFAFTSLHLIAAAVDAPFRAIQGSSKYCAVGIKNQAVRKQGQPADSKGDRHLSGRVTRTTQQGSLNQMTEVHKACDYQVSSRIAHHLGEALGDKGMDILVSADGVFCRFLWLSPLLLQP